LQFSLFSVCFVSVAQGAKHWKGQPFSLLNTYPKEAFSEQRMSLSLEQLGKLPFRKHFSWRSSLSYSHVQGLYQMRRFGLKLAT
jgi:hypothetical protein